MNSKRDKKMFLAAAAVMTAALVMIGATYTFGRDSSTTAHRSITTPVAAEIATPAAPPVHQTAEGRALLESFSDAFEGAAAAVNPSVVPIFSEQHVRATEWFSMPGGQGNIPEPFRDLFPHFFGAPGGNAPEQTLHSLGSGVIVSPDGYILTNNHVVQDSDKLTVAVDKKRYQAEVVGTDPETDVAVIKIDARDLPAATLGTSDDLHVGQWVIAVGNPLEMLHSVTAGIISATGRSSVGLTNYEDFIQTDASINPGNSGGALADLDGRVIGINTAIASPTGSNVGIGFAIPIDLARQVMDDLITNGKITRGYVGLMLQDVTDDLATALGLPRAEGVLVSDVVPDGPGARAGIERGDVILSFEGHKIDNGAQLRNLVAAAEPNSRARFTVLRDGHERDFTVELGERPTDNGTSNGAPGSDESPHGRLGLSVTNLTPDLAARLNLGNARGVLVTGVTSGSPADDAGIRQGDLIEKVAGSEVGSVSELRNVLSGLSSGKTIALLVRRGENTFFAAVHLP